VLAAPGGPALPLEMLVAAVVTTLAVLVLTAALLAVRYRIEARRDEREELAVAAQLELSGSSTR
jgi:hypothetical protein